MKTSFKRLWPFATLLFFSLVFHFAFLGQPNEIVFDEIHFANYATYYLTGDYYFDIHPPLGKLMLAGLLGAFGDNSFFNIRFLPALFGSFFVLAVSWLAFILTRSKNTALIAGFLTLLDNALLVQSRLALLDIFLLFFMVLSLGFFFIFLRQKKYSGKWFTFLSLTGISSGLVFSIKWTGLTIAGIIFVILFLKIFNKKQKLKVSVISFATIIILGLAVYTLPFVLHFKTLTSFERQNFPMEQFSYGKGEIQSSQNFFQKFGTLNSQMLTANLESAAKNPDSSAWFKWPLNQRPLHYSSNIYFKGNTALWLLITALVIITVAKIALKKDMPFDKTQDNPGEKDIFTILLLGYFINLLPFVLIGRTTFMYHYLPALVFGIILAAYWLNTFRKRIKPIFVAIFAIIIVNFLIFLPQTFGLAT